MMQKRTAVKNQQWMKDSVARRQAVLLQQRQARRDLALHARQLLTDDSSSGNEDGKSNRRNRRHRGSDASAAVDDGMEVSSTYANGGGDTQSKRKTREERVKQRREHFAKQLMVPEWMIDIPRDLNGKGSETGAGWYVLPRPEGKRCLVIANNGITVARIPSGSILKRFPSALPSGSHKTNASTESYCILDCIFHEHDSTFYVLDVMCWKGYLLYNCTTEFRLYWLRDKLSESTISTVSPANPYRFMPIPCYESDEHGICEAYSGTFPFLKDGLLFYMKVAHYELGLSPLVLVWKDANTSRYFVYTEKPNIVLRLDGANQFTTLEGITFFTADSDFVKQHELSEGDLAKFSFDHGYIDDDNKPCVAGLQFDKRCSPQRALADSWTKILFQYNARSGGVQIQHILEVAKTKAESNAEAVMED
uniref:Snurportin-1 n=1 Tax=Globisporangium ultimum (strain ATCC 200006 / CBS 805.95 / DAOM BR144) TaxID=431595 RepID=K3W9X0_GLOUD